MIFYLHHKMKKLAEVPSEPELPQVFCCKYTGSLAGSGDSRKICFLSFYRCSPMKNMAKVPGPEWEPMTAPT